MQVLDEAFAGTGRAGQTFASWVRSAVSNDSALAQAASTADGLELLRDGLRIAQRRERVSAKAAGALAAALGRLGISATGIGDTPEDQLEQRRLAASRER